ncbi:MAG: hypothetical protein ACJ8AD_17665 [Gemmatimonadaceae bacterium]
MHPRRRFLTLLLLLSSACAANQPSESAPRGDRNVLTQQELLDQHFSNAYEAVEALRSQWLTARGPDSFKTPSQVWVYQDNVKLGDVQTLRGVAVNSILSIRRLNANEATARWGVGNSAGAIWLQTLSAASPSSTSSPPR